MLTNKTAPPLVAPMEPSAITDEMCKNITHKLTSGELVANEKDGVFKFSDRHVAVIGYPDAGTTLVIGRTDSNGNTQTQAKKLYEMYCTHKAYREAKKTLIGTYTAKNFTYSTTWKNGVNTEANRGDGAIALQTVTGDMVGKYIEGKDAVRKVKAINLTNNPKFIHPTYISGNAGLSGFMHPTQLKVYAIQPADMKAAFDTVNKSLTVKRIKSAESIKPVKTDKTQPEQLESISTTDFNYHTSWQKGVVGDNIAINFKPFADPKHLEGQYIKVGNTTRQIIEEMSHNNPPCVRTRIIEGNTDIKVFAHPQTFELSQVLPKNSTIIGSNNEPLNKDQQNIQDFLNNINDEIDKIAIPQKYLHNQVALRQAIKDKFDIYRKKFNDHKKFCPSTTLKSDLAILKDMQKYMYFSLHSPQAKEIDLSLPTIKNVSAKCLYIAKNQYELHNKYFIFFVKAYQLLGSVALKSQLPPVIVDKPYTPKTAPTVLGATGGQSTSIQIEIEKTAAELAEKSKPYYQLRQEITEERKCLGDNYTGNIKESEEFKRFKLKEKKIDSTGDTLIAEIVNLKEKLSKLNKQKDEAKIAKGIGQAKEKAVFNVRKRQKQASDDETKLANLWSTFYNQLLSGKEKINLPDPKGPDRGPENEFPTALFGVPDSLSLKDYDYIPKNAIRTTLQKPWRAIIIDMNGGHFFTYVRRTDGTIDKVNDSHVEKASFKNVELLIQNYTRQDCQYGIRVNKDFLK